MNGNRVRLSVVASTNMHTTELLSQSVIDEWTLVTADYQESGRGQRGKSWQSDPRSNLLSTLVYLPKIEIRKQYLISAAASLTLVELLQDHGIIARVKWPNDVFVNGRKIAGFLIESQLKSSKVESSLIGLGLNVNQTEFDHFDWEATSMKLETGLTFDLEEISHLWQLKARTEIPVWITRETELIQALNHKMFLRNKEVELLYQEKRMTGLVTGVLASGELQMETENGKKTFVNGEIKILNTSL